MLLLWRERGQVIEITHRSGDVLTIAVSEFRHLGGAPTVRLGFGDDARNFLIMRSELPEETKERYSS